MYLLWSFFAGVAGIPRCCPGCEIFGADLLTNPLAPAACIVATFSAFARSVPRLEQRGARLLRIRKSLASDRQCEFSAFAARLIRAAEFPARGVRRWSRAGG